MTPPEEVHPSSTFEASAAAVGALDGSGAIGGVEVDDAPPQATTLTTAMRCTRRSHSRAWNLTRVATTIERLLRPRDGGPRLNA